MSFAATPQFLLEQERIRRGSHKYAPDPNRGGMNSYQPETYAHQEYPKMMLTTPRPQFREFRKSVLADQGDNELQRLLLGQKLDMQSLYEAACREWDEESQVSIVKNKAEEDAWLAEHQEAKAPMVTTSVKETALGIKAQREALKAQNPVTEVRKAR